MFKNKAEHYDAERVEELLHQHGTTHLRARKYGSAVLVEFGPEVEPSKHFRVRRDTVHRWCLDMADHHG
ncbi:MAG: hypothetical protein GY811_28870 [Myxococcales bacterium]|nr:hypothetical protein [Myxococcales bacterium]